MQLLATDHTFLVLGPGQIFACEGILMPSDRGETICQYTVRCKSLKGELLQINSADFLKFKGPMADTKEAIRFFMEDYAKKV